MLLISPLYLISPSRCGVVSTPVAGCELGCLNITEPFATLRFCLGVNVGSECANHTWHVWS